MRWIIPVVCSTVLLPSVFAEDRPAAIAVVKTWEDLQAAPAIDVGGGVKIRLGLEADKIPQWNGALLYCLAEGCTPPGSGSGQIPFGPVHARFSFEKEKKADGVIAWGTGEKKEKGTYLYVRGLSIVRVGTYHVGVTDAKDKLLAEAAVEGTRAAAPALRAMYKRSKLDFERGEIRHALDKIDKDAAEESR